MMCDSNQYQNEQDFQFSTRNMSIKVLYSFDESSIVFLARSSTTVDIKVVDVPLSGSNQLVTLGVIELYRCIKQVVTASPESFANSSIDYAVYATDVSEPDEPLVGYGLVSQIIESDNNAKVPGRVRSNFSALFGGSNSSQTLEVKFKFRKVEHKGSPSKKRILSMISKAKSSPRPPSDMSSPIAEKFASTLTATVASPINFNPSLSRSNLEQQSNQQPVALSTFSNPAPPILKIHQPFEAEIIDNKRKKKRANPAQRAERTQSLPNFPNSQNMNFQMSFQQNQQNPLPPQVASRFRDSSFNTTTGIITKLTPSSLPIINQAKRGADKLVQNTIPEEPAEEGDDGDDGRVCMNDNCQIKTSIIWRALKIQDGPAGDICNACFMFYKTRGFMRPAKTVRDYNRNRKYTRQHAALSSSPVCELLDETESEGSATIDYSDNDDSEDNKEDNDVEEEDDEDGEDDEDDEDYVDEEEEADKITNPRKRSIVDDPCKSPSFNDINDIMNDLNRFSGPATDIDPLPDYLHHQQHRDNNSGIATKLNTTVINLFEDDKENLPPKSLRPSPSKMSKNFNDFENMLSSFGQISQNNSPSKINMHIVNSGLIESPTQWINSLLRDPTPKGTPNDAATCNTVTCDTPIEMRNNDIPPVIHRRSSKSMRKTPNIPSSPFLTTELETTPQELHSILRSNANARLANLEQLAQNSANVSLSNKASGKSKKPSDGNGNTSMTIQSSSPRMATWEVMSSPPTEF